MDGGRTRASSLYREVRILAVPEHHYPTTSATYEVLVRIIAKFKITGIKKGRRESYPLIAAPLSVLCCYRSLILKTLGTPR